MMAANVSESAQAPAAPVTPAIELDNVSAGYGRLVVLRNITLSVREGEVVGILGPNGAGKTSLLRTISRLTRIADGRLRVWGTDATEAEPWQIARLGVGHVLEGRRMFRGLTVRDSLLVGYRGSRGERAALLERTFAIFPRLAERHKQLAQTLSGGEQQMVAIGRVLMTNPRLILLDEPSQGLSPAMVDILMESVRAISLTGLGIVLVEQNVEIAQSVINRAVVISRGSVTNMIEHTQDGAGEIAKAMLSDLY
jgi:branched-chain amino acid transport system ATP-binding protein